jgi:ferrous-iron efflux pump FieF
MHKHDHDDSDHLKNATTLSVSTASVIICLKLFGYIMTGSVAMLATLVDSIIDLGSSLINFIAIRFSLKPSTNKFRYGFSKAEDLAIFSQGSFFMLSGIFLIAEACKRFLEPRSIDQGGTGIIVLLICIFLTLVLLTYQRYVIKKTNSNVIKADYLHYSIDLFSNVSVIITIAIVTQFDLQIVDPIFGLLVGVYIIYGAWKIFTQSLKNLLDHEMSDEDRAKIEKILKNEKEIKEFHDFKSRYAGQKIFMQVHVEMDPKITLEKAYNITHALQKKIKKIFPKSEIIFNKDPYGLDNHPKEFR